LSPEELLGLLGGMKIAARVGGLRFETMVTTWLVRLMNQIPSGFREIIFFRQKSAKAILIRESARATLWMAIVLVLDSFYFGRKAGIPQVNEEILRKLESESRRCVPRLPPALSSHSAVSPWPDAFLTLGRSCLLPETAVNLRS